MGTVPPICSGMQLLLVLALTFALVSSMRPKCTDNSKPTSCKDGNKPTRPDGGGPPTCSDGNRPLCKDGNEPVRPPPCKDGSTPSCTGASPVCPDDSPLNTDTFPLALVGVLSVLTTPSHLLVMTEHLQSLEDVDVMEEEGGEGMEVERDGEEDNF